jgi:hypothetical protein
VYGGAYAYGKTECTVHYEAGEPRKRDRRKPRDQWLSLIPNAHDGYVDWDEFERIQRAIRANVRMGAHAGAPKNGEALATGLLRCRRCASKLTVHYTGSRHDALRYSCHRAWLDKGLPRCIAFGGTRVDAAIAQAVLQVVQPGAIEAAIVAREEETHKHDEALTALQRDLQAARYTAHRAQKQYDTADPENRLVADELERRWNDALLRVEELESRIEQRSHVSGQIPPVQPDEFNDLAAALELIWPQADSRLKKRIVRTLIHEVVVDLDNATSEIVLVIHWKGGVHTEIRVPHRRRGQCATQTSPEAIDAVRLLARICPDLVIASMLNRNGLRTGRGNFWTQERVTALRSHHRIPVYSSERRAAEGWMNLTEASALIGVSPKTLRLAVERGEIAAEHPLSLGPWIFTRDSLNTSAVVEFVARTRARRAHPTIPTTEQGSLDLSST